MKSKAVQASLVLGLIMILREQKKPRGIRNNNPLNIRENGTKWEGKIGDDGEFVQFETPEKGIRAAARIIKTYRDKYGLNSVAGIIQRWAPPSENDTVSYVESVAQQVGIGRNEPLLEFDYPKLITAMIKHENGQQPYDATTIESGFKQGFYA